MIQPRTLWWKLAQSLWFVPSLMVLGAVLLAAGLVEAETFVKLGRLFPRVFGVGPDGARGMLTAIASSMITVAGVVFSVTIVALSLAASQYSPRVLRTFSDDRPTQLVLGVFVGVFVYCLVVLRTIRGGDSNSYVPSLAVLGGLVLALVGTGFLIFFIHHMAASIQPSAILSRISTATLATIDVLFPEGVGAPADELDSEEIESGTTWTTVASPRTGYVIHVSKTGLLACAKKSGRLVRMDAAIGDFVVEGQPIASLEGSLPVEEAEAKALVNNYSLDRQRTLEQDADFGFQQMVDIASKALSPGINDASTAILCIDRITQVLARVAIRRIESRLRESDGQLRVIARGPTFESLVELAYFAIGRDARGNAVVLMRLVWSLERVASVTTNSARRQVLAEQLRRLEGSLLRSDGTSVEQKAVVSRARALREQLVGTPEANL